MNRITIIGNLTKDVDLKSTRAGIPVCTFTVAVNRKTKAEAGQPDADFFRVTCWRVLAENCARFLSKGKKVCVVGSVTVSTYKAADGTVRASMDVNADEIEFLSPKEAQPTQTLQQQQDVKAGFVPVDDDGSLPF